jgi:hypothetical protein
MVRGRPRIGGQRRVFLNLCAGLDRIGVRYRINNYRYARQHPDELACIIGKPGVLNKAKWTNPILFGASGYSEPVTDPHLLERLPVRRVLVPGPWVETMCRPVWGQAVKAWAVGVDTEFWKPGDQAAKRYDVLLYDKIRWDHSRYDSDLIDPIRHHLRSRGHTFRELRYGDYREEDLCASLSECRVMIFLCEHETQGIAYQQALSCGVPILAWDRGGPWQDPAFYPHKIVFEPVSSVPYWDDRCGMRFSTPSEFEAAWDRFWADFSAGRFDPRSYILEHLTLEKCASEYVRTVEDLSEQA